MVRVELEISDAERERFVRQAERQGMTLDGWLVKIARQHAAEPEAADDEAPAGRTPSGNAGQSILEMFDEIHRSMPEGAFDDLPTDGARNYKHYLYGFPKEEDEQ
ncbi:MAG: hypothetical protein OXL37_12795 [Chloroflexota bacterium]|nr:hypothetical protein [Chloroflexota bacterium]MDE2960120.1 hypothetical protein [Chloroflexota bacterium]